MFGQFACHLLVQFSRLCLHVIYTRNLFPSPLVLFVLQLSPPLSDILKPSPPCLPIPSNFSTKCLGLSTCPLRVHTSAGFQTLFQRDPLWGHCLVSTSQDLFL
uniref:Uncharacterized protein n=1 Tax=Opuntia streptacantha TaxID=393608 RepID=A0A7C9EFX1_OPUST